MDILIEADSGDYIGHFAKKLIKEAKRHNEVVYGNFNEIKLVAYPDSSAREIVYQYNHKHDVRRSYLR